MSETTATFTSVEPVPTKESGPVAPNSYGADDIYFLLRAWIASGSPVRVTTAVSASGEIKSANTKAGEKGCGCSKVKTGQALGACVSFIPGQYPGTRVPLYNNCSSCMVCSIGWSNGTVGHFPVGGRQTLWIDSHGLAGNIMGEYPCAATPSAEQEISFRGDPPENIKKLAAQISANKRGEQSIAAKDIPAEILKELNEYCRQISKNKDCSIIALYGCRSCCNDGQYGGNLVNTSCGWQCWTCAYDGC